MKSMIYAVISLAITSSSAIAADLPTFDEIVKKAEARFKLDQRTDDLELCHRLRAGGDRRVLHFPRPALSPFHWGDVRLRAPPRGCSILPIFMLRP